VFVYSRSKKCLCVDEIKPVHENLNFNIKYHRIKTEKCRVTNV